MPPSTSHQQQNGSSPKRQKSNLGSALRKPPGPEYEKGIEYWDRIEASVDGVLGGFGNGPVPHIDQLSSRLFLLSLLPALHTFPSPLTPSPPPAPVHRLTALDVGAGIGRVTNHTLLPLFEDIVLLEPVSKFVETAYRSARNGEWKDLPKGSQSQNDELMGVDDENDEEKKNQSEVGKRGKRVEFFEGGLQGFDPSWPKRSARSLGIVGEARSGESGGFGGEGDEKVVYVAIWCQWCLGHMSHADLVTFLQKSRAALRDTRSTGTSASGGGYESLIFVKENVCEDGPTGRPTEFLDPEDSSLTRSNGRWLEIFADAGLEVVKEEIQEGLPAELFMVKTWALR